VLATHDPDHTFAVAKHAALMRDGMLLAYGTPNETVTAANLRAMYGVTVAIERLASGNRVCAVSL
jgi:iron complex transport system ATP-binding protein